MSSLFKEAVTQTLRIKTKHSKNMYSTVYESINQTIYRENATYVDCNFSETNYYKLQRHRN